MADVSLARLGCGVSQPQPSCMKDDGTERGGEERGGIERDGRGCVCVWSSWSLGEGDIELAVMSLAAGCLVFAAVIVFCLVFWRFVRALPRWRGRSNQGGVSGAVGDLYSTKHCLVLQEVVTLDMKCL